MQKKYLAPLVIIFIVCLLLLAGWTYTGSYSHDEIQFEEAAKTQPEFSGIVYSFAPTADMTQQLIPEENHHESAKPQATLTPKPEIANTTPTSTPSATPASDVVQHESIHSSGLYTDSDAIMIAKVMGQECPSVASVTEQACVAWCILNRYDAGFASSIAGVITAPNQFAYYSGTAVRQDLYELALDVLSRWAAEKNGAADVGRVLPPEYKWFKGDFVAHNYFRDQYQGGNIWDYSLPSPYST